MTELEKVKAERDEYLAGWQRAKADFANQKKQTEAMMKEFRTMANEGLIEELLPVLSSFEMAFANREAWERVDKNWRMGVEHIYNQLKGILISSGLKEIDPLGQKFDHNLHEAVAHEAVEDAKKEHHVLRVMEKGYMLGTKLIRPAKVVVGEPKVG
ncbi:MAG: nucleotide exchange factor GrpE [Patescibacteria group bacterium]|nr:nucleotide exchange factor GrpE [Patescibacteria group bacterium]